MKNIYVLGIGHYTPVCIELAEACGYEVCGLYNYCNARIGEEDHGYPILGSFDDLFSKESLYGMSFLLTMGDPKIRLDLYEKIAEKGGDVPTLIHPTAIISKFARISPKGTMIFQFTNIQTDTIIDKCVTLSPFTEISHNVHIQQGCFIATKSIIGAYTDIGDHVFWGMGAISISGKVKSIGNYSVIGAGALVTKDVPENVTVIGVPAKVAYINNEH